MVDSHGVEPSAEIRQAAHITRELYLALLQENFTEEQALRVVGYAISGGQGK